MTLRSNAIAALVAVVAFVVYAATWAHSITWAADVSDSGELAAAAYVLGVPHPTGYPLYMLIGWVVSHLPIGTEPAFRLTVLSALCGAVSAGAACLLVAILVSAKESNHLNSSHGGICGRAADRHGGKSLPLRGASSHGSILGACAGIIFGGSACAMMPALWRQATAPETRAPVLALVLWALFLLLQSCLKHDRRMLVGAWAVWGVALADHLLSMALFLALVIATAAMAHADRWRRPRGHQGAKLWLSAALAVIPGASLYAYLPLRAQAHPALNWGDPQTPGRFIWVVTGAEYRSEMGVPLAALLGRAGDRLGTVGAVLGPELIVAGLAGLVLIWLRCRMAALILASVCVTSFGQSALYGADAAPTYLLPAEAVLCVCAGCTVAYLAGATRGRVLSAIVVVGLVAVTAAHDVTAVQSMQHSADDGAAERFARVALTRLPAHATILVSGDRDTFALWYAQFGLELRPDVAVVNTDLLGWQWYRANLQRAYPWLIWGGQWDSDGASNADSRAATRLDAFVAAMVPRYPLYWTSIAELNPTFCEAVRVANLYRCVPVQSGGP